MSRIEDLAARLHALDAGALPGADRALLDLHILDTVGASVAGRFTEEGQALFDFLDPAPAAGRGALLDRVAAAVGSTRLTEIDNIHMASGVTPGAIAIPAALVLAEATQSPPDVFAAACLAGMEAMTALGAAIGGQAILYRGIWTTCLLAPAGTAAAASRLLGLTPDQTAHALAIALGGMAGRVGRPGTGKTARWLLAAEAARSGALAAFAAREGFRGDAGLLDGGGLERSHGISPAADAPTAPPAGNVLAELSFKPFCAAKQTMAAIAAFRSLLERGVPVDAIVAIRVDVAPDHAAMIRNLPVAGDRASGTVSLAYLLACAALRPEALYELERRITDLPAAMAELMARVEVHPDAGMAAHLPGRWAARVTVETAGGGRLSAEVIDAPGDPGTGFGATEVTEKLRCFAAPHLAGRSFDALAAAALRAGHEIGALRQLTTALGGLWRREPDRG